MGQLDEQDCNIIPDSLGAGWFFERYQCPRFTQPDEKVDIILDIFHFLKGVCKNKHKTIAFHGFRT